MRFYLKSSKTGGIKEDTQNRHLISYTNAHALTNQSSNDPPISQDLVAKVMLKGLGASSSSFSVKLSECILHSTLNDDPNIFHY